MRSETAYGGPLAIPLRPDRATILMNFVSTLDGIVALGPGEQAGGGVISGHNEADRFVMALLRAVADVVLMGAGTIAGGSSHQWTAEHLHPASAPAFREWRAALGLAEQPTVVIVTGSGDIRLGRRGLDDPSVPVVLATTTAGAASPGGARPALPRPDRGCRIRRGAVGRGDRDRPRPGRRSGRPVRRRAAPVRQPRRRRPRRRAVPDRGAPDRRAGQGPARHGRGRSSCRPTMPAGRSSRRSSATATTCSCGIAAGRDPGGAVRRIAAVESNGRRSDDRRPLHDQGLCPRISSRRRSRRRRRAGAPTSRGP